MKWKKDGSAWKGMKAAALILLLGGHCVVLGSGDAWPELERELQELEGSVDLEKARAAYVELLWEGRPEGGVEWETQRLEAYASYLSRALTLPLEPLERARMLLLVATVESMLAGVDTRREEVLLRSALELAAGDPLSALVGLRLGEYYVRQAEREGTAPGQRWYASAAEQLRRVEASALADSEMVVSARKLLAQVTQPQLEVDVAARFAPQAEVRIAVKVRNVETLVVEVLSAAGESLLLLPERLPETVAGVHDWRSHTVVLGELTAPGIYPLRVVADDLQQTTRLWISQAQLIGLESASGDLWLASYDGVTGEPLAASVRLLDANAQLITTANIAEDGSGVLLAAANVSGWARAELESAVGAAMLEPSAVQLLEPRILVLPVAAMAQPGGALEWLAYLADTNSGSWRDWLVQLPDGRQLPIVPMAEEAGWLRLAVELPEDISVGGSVRLKAGSYAHHIGQVILEKIPGFRLVLRGQQVAAELPVYPRASPPLLSIEPLNDAADFFVPAFVEMRVWRHDRPRRVAVDQWTHDPVLLFDSLVTWDRLGERSGSLVLPDLEAVAASDVYQIQVSDPRNGELLGSAWCILSTVTAEGRLRTDVAFANTGSTVDLHWDITSLGNVEAPRRVEVLIQREIWERRYAHRRRGHQISEQAYLNLPERSLLGSARTDFSLLREGFRAEEVARHVLEPSGSGVISFFADQAGHYRAELRHPDMEPVQAAFHIIPKAIEDSRWLRSPVPRLVADSIEGRVGLLLLAGQAGFVHLLWELDDGEMRAQSLPLVLPFMEFAPPADIADRVRVVHAVVLQDGEATHLTQPLQQPVLQTFNVHDLPYPTAQPGAGFAWDIALPGAAEGDWLWTFGKQGMAGDIASGLSGQLSSPVWQQGGHSRLLEADSVLPLQRVAREATDTTDFAHARSPEAFFSQLSWRFPELVQAYRPQPVLPWQTAQHVADNSWQISGSLPETAAAWELNFIRAQQQTLWIGSHLLAIAGRLDLRLDGPSWARTGDQLTLELQPDEEGATPLVELSWDWAGGLMPVDALPQQVDFSVQQGPLELSFDAVGAGEAQLQATASSGGIAEASTHLCRIIDPPASMQLQLLASTTYQRPDAVPETAAAVDGEAAFVAAWWQQMRHYYRSTEPDLAAITDWAVAYVIGSTSEPPPESLAAAIARLQLADGSFAWREGLRGDLEWTATLVTVLNRLLASKGGLGAVLGDGRSEATLGLLRLVMLDSERPVAERVAALAALPVVDPARDFARPTRLQARAFLHLYALRGQFSALDTARMLDLAAIYEFAEEYGALLQQLGEQEVPAASAATAYLGIRGAAYAQTHLERAQLARAAAEALVEGSARVQWQAIPQLLLLLVAADRDRFSEERMQLAGWLWGNPARHAEPHPEPEVVLQRVHKRPTLLAGVREEITPWSSGDPLLNGDRLLLRINAEVAQASRWLEWVLPLPAGLTSRSVPVVLLNGEQVGEMWRTAERSGWRIVMSNAEAGTLVVQWELEARWRGSFSWPAAQLRDPLNGDARNYSLSTEPLVVE